MKILIVYEQGTMNYCYFCEAELERLGFQVGSIALEDYNLNLDITTTPAFLIYRDGKVGYPLLGKQNLDTLTEWATSAGVECS